MSDTTDVVSLGTCSDCGIYHGSWEPCPSPRPVAAEIRLLAEQARAADAKAADFPTDAGACEAAQLARARLLDLCTPLNLLASLAVSAPSAPGREPA